MRGRDRAAGDGGDPSDEAMLGDVGLALPDHPPEELGLDDASGRILASVTGGAFSASPADLTGALELPLHPVGLPAGVDSRVLLRRGNRRREWVRPRSPDSRRPREWRDDVSEGCRSAAVGGEQGLRGGLERFSVGGGEGGCGGPGPPRQSAPYLPHLMESQRPELFAGSDGSLPLGKRWKGCQRSSGGMLLDSEHFGLEEEDASLVYGGSQNIGDLEDMPIFGEGKKLAFVVGEEIPALRQGNAERGSHIFLDSDVNLLGHKMECNDREGGCSQSSAWQEDYISQQQVVSMTQSRPESKPKCFIETEVEDDNNVNVDGIPLIRNDPLGTTSYLPQLQEVGGIHNYGTLLPFQVCMQQIRGYAPAMVSGYLDIEKTCRDTRHDVERIKKMVMEKDHLYAAIVSDIAEELRERRTIMCSFEADMDMISCAVQQYGKKLEKSLAEFQEYRNRITRGEGVALYSEVLGTSGEQNHARVQQGINRIGQTWFLTSLNLMEKITKMETVMANINHEVQRLKDSRSIPDLNNGVEDDGEGEASLSKMVDRSLGIEGCRVSNTTQGLLEEWEQFGQVKAVTMDILKEGKQLVELIANPDQRNIIGESMDLDGVQQCRSEDEVGHSAASQGTG